LIEETMRRVRMSSLHNYGVTVGRSSFVEASGDLEMSSLDISAVSLDTGVGALR
jgi:hypothetical protein